MGGLEQFARESASYLSLVNSFENADSLDPLMFFYERRTEFPILKTLADSLLAVQSTSAASESFFSEGRRTITDERSGLQPRRAARLIVSRIRRKIRLVGLPQLFYMFPHSITVESEARRKNVGDSKMGPHKIRKYRHGSVQERRRGRVG